VRVEGAISVEPFPSDDETHKVGGDADKTILPIVNNAIKANAQITKSGALITL